MRCNYQTYSSLINTCEYIQNHGIQKSFEYIFQDKVVFFKYNEIIKL